MSMEPIRSGLVSTQRHKAGLPMTETEAFFKTLPIEPDIMTIPKLKTGDRRAYEETGSAGYYSAKTDADGIITAGKQLSIYRHARAPEG